MTSSYAPQNNSGQINQAMNTNNASPGQRYGGGNFSMSGGYTGGMRKQQPLQQSYVSPTSSGTAVGATMNAPFSFQDRMGSNRGFTGGTNFTNPQFSQSQPQQTGYGGGLSSTEGIDPRLLDLYKQHGVTPGASGAGFSDAGYWNNKIGSAGWDYINNRLGADLSGTGTDQPGPGDIGNMSGMGAPSGNIMEMLSQLFGQKQGPTYMGSQPGGMQQPRQMMPRNMSTTMAPQNSIYGPQMYGSQMNNPMDISSFLGH